MPARERIAREDESTLVDALRAGDESAFVALVDRYGPSMLRAAETFVSSRAVAEEVVQEAWLGVLKGLDRFERRSSLKTWIFRILANVAKTRGVREKRSVPFSSLAASEAGSFDPAVDPGRFHAGGDSGPAGTWRTPPLPWDESPDARLIASETLARIDEAIEALPEAQRTVLRLRDVQGFTADQVCNVLEISETNQRVLLHRARSKVRRSLEQYLTGG